MLKILYFFLFGCEPLSSYVSGEVFFKGMNSINYNGLHQVSYRMFNCNGLQYCRHGQYYFKSSPPMEHEHSLICFSSFPPFIFSCGATLYPPLCVCVCVCLCVWCPPFCVSSKYASNSATPDRFFVHVYFILHYCSPFILITFFLLIFAKLIFKSSLAWRLI